jgi:uncharacterized protein (UPF0333 family)
MNNPKDKAKELISKYVHLAKQTTGANGTIYNSKQCALIAVDEILKFCENEISHCSDKTYFYWQEVKIEIEKL